MKFFFRQVLFLSVILFSIKLQAQVNMDTDTLGVVIHADSRLAILTKKHKSLIGSGVIRSGSGFRVQIYNGNDRSKANAVKVDFIRRYPNIKTYMTYVQPQFRVKVGDFLTRTDAQKFAEQLRNFFSPVIIVPDIITINTLKND